MRKISVIIPFYSHVDWLSEAIESVLAQTYNNYEIILVNDGSKENLTEFLSKYGEKIIYIEQKNGGPATARNTGIRRATGDYIAFEDSDDVWFPTKLEKQLAFMESTGAKWCHTGFYYWWPNTGKLKLVDTSKVYGDIYQRRFVSTQIATPSLMLHRSLFDNPDFFFPEGVRNGEDDFLYTRLAKDYPIGLVEEPLMNVRMRGGNSNSHAVERFNIRKKNYDRWLNEGLEFPMIVRAIYGFYGFYCKLFGSSTNKYKEFLAKCCWTIPYFLERIYVNKILKHKTSDIKYIKHYGTSIG